MSVVLVFAYLMFGGLYLLLAWENWGLPPTRVSVFLAEQVNTDHENSALELFSAAAWLLATFLFSRACLNHWKIVGRKWSSAWLFGFAVLCLVAFGEEISWGTHWTGPDYLSDHVNSRWSIHNQRIGDLELQFYTRLVFYAGLLVLWVALPSLKHYQPLKQWTAFASIPAAGRAVVIFFVIDTAVYLTLDRFFEAGRIFEASTGVVAILVAMTMKNDSKRELHRAEENA